MAERRPVEEGYWDRAASHSLLPALRQKEKFFLTFILVSLFASSSAQTLDDFLLCRAGSASSVVQAGLEYSYCPSTGACEQRSGVSNGQDTVNITAAVSSTVKFKVRFNGFSAPPSSVDVLPTRLRSRVTVGPILEDSQGPYAWVEWFNSTSDISIPYNCLDLDILPESTCAYRVCRKDCTTPVFSLEHLGGEFVSAGGVGTRESPIMLEKVLPAQVGERLEFELKLRNLVLTDLVDIEGRVDGGVPIGMEFGAKAMEGTSTTTRTVSWTPHSGQQGLEHVAHFVGWNCPPAGDTVPCDVSMVFLDIKFAVESPIVGWMYPDTGGPIPADVLSQRVVVGARTEIELACRATDSSSMPQITLLNASIDGELVDPAQREGPMGAFGWELVDDEVDAATDRRRLLRFDFTPAVGDEGGLKEWCFSCGDAQGLGGPNVRCIALQTQLCRVHVQPGDTLQGITRRYHLDRNWRRLWNANPDIPNPYVELHAGQDLQVGPVYRVRQGDTLGSIAARFETTVKKVLMVNPHLGETDARELGVGTDMCVLPCTDKPPPSHFMGSRLLEADHE